MVWNDAWWNRATFSLTKNVSGTQMSLMYSAPTTSFTQKCNINSQFFSTYFAVSFKLIRLQKCQCSKYRTMLGSNLMSMIIKALRTYERIRQWPVTDKVAKGLVQWPSNICDWRLVHWLTSRNPDFQIFNTTNHGYGTSATVRDSNT